MKLKEQIQNFLENESGKPRDTLAQVKKILHRMQLEGVAPGIPIGSRAPGFCLNDSDENPVCLDDLLGKGPVVISFYRGDWCPFCNLELRALNDIYENVKKQGGSLVAIGPQTTAMAKQLKERHGIKYTLLNDTEQKVIDEYRLRFTIPTDLKKLENIDLTTKNANGRAELPVPATYILDSKGIVRDRFVSMDYTRRMEPQMALESATSVSYFESVFQQIPVAASILASDGSVIDFNDEFAQMFEISEPDLFKHINFFSLPDLKNSTVIQSVMKVYNERIDTISREHEKIILNGVTRYIDFKVAPVKQTGNRAGVILTVIDRTVEVNQKRNLEKLNRRLTEINQTNRQLMSILGHDLRNPISSIQTLAGYLKEKYSILSDEMVKNYLEELASSGLNTLNLLNNLLTWAQSQEGSLKAEWKVANLSILAEKTVNLVKPMVFNKRISLKTEIEPDLIIEADAYMIETVIRNLLTNAVKFTQSDKEISLLLREVDSRIKIEIADTGVGMSPELVSRLNSGEIVTSSGTEGETGTGLGMALVREFIDRNRGELFIQSEVNKGSRFTVEFPKVNRRYTEVEQKVADHVESAAGALNILLVEDDPIIREISYRTLSDNGHHITTASTRREFCEYYSKDRFDLVLTDIQMPDGDMTDEIGKLYQKSEFGLLNRFILFSSSDEEYLKNIVEEFRLRGYLQKPFNYNKLIQVYSAGQYN